MHAKLGAKFLMVGLLLTVIPITVIGVFTVIESTQSISSMARDDLSLVAGNLAETLNLGMDDLLLIVRNIATTKVTTDAAEKVARAGIPGSQNEIALADERLLQIKVNIGERCSSVNVCDSRGIIFATTSAANRGGDLSDRDYMVAALKGKANVGVVVVSKFTGRIISTVAAPIFASDGTTVIGVAAMGMEIGFLTDMIDNVKIGKTGYATLANRTGLTITHPVKENILKENITTVAGMEPVARQIARGETGIVGYKRDGIAKIAAIAYVPITGWTVLVTIERTDLYSSVATLRNQIISTGGVAIVLAVLLLWFFSRSITRPLNGIVGAAEGIASGDLSIETAYSSRYDEIGSLARAFTAMVAWLNGMAKSAGRIASGDLTEDIAPLSERDILGNAFSTMVNKLRNHINGINEGVAVLTSAGSEILAATTQVVSGTTETASAITETTSTVEEVRQAAQLSSEKARNVSENYQHVNEASESGQKAVEDTSTVMLHIRDQMEAIAQIIVRLSEQSLSIGGIIASVTELADQSNLLAVNTAIEAARAGDQGKGFGVIAMEIRNLAEQSKQATIQVRAILNEVQKLTGTAVMAAEQGTKAVQAGVDQSTRAGDAIRTLAESSAEATQAAVQIVSSSRQQVIGMEQIGIAMSSINQAGTQTATSMRQVEIVAQNLHELGQKLKSLVDQFKA